ncbi:hypothetical protein [Anabaena subtropica]|uniref:Uncharacterized protein n=1 Tax=Anabaena subtropica FACHB-260 TaxID=2692884 RepID=A0ABR8CNG3_9NOST|nr:hypothetical protein [Anabaena subtropica]MBD2344725.1 hypothetical protein [Anabaena subtropica FACHB-260]
MKFVKNIFILLSSLAVVITVCESANAGKKGLNVGNGRITPGLEKQYLQYQLQNNGNGSGSIRVIPDNCVVGFGLRCNKTGTILEQIIESNGGPSYQEMLMKAAGGENNYRRFANFYNNKIDDGPYMSIWRNHSSRILDSAQYSLGKPLDRNPVAGLRDITKNFFWKPLPGGNLRDDFVNLKYSYGRVLLEEVSRVPNLREQIMEMNLGASLRKFYETQVLNGLNALNTGNNGQLQQNILSILSRPYSPSLKNNPWFGREDMTLVSVAESGEVISADSLTYIPEEASGLELTEEIAELSGAEFSFMPSDGSIGIWPIGVMLLFALFLVDFSSGGNDSSSDSPFGTSGVPTPSTNSPGNVCDFLNPGGAGVPSGNQNVVVCETPIVTPEVAPRRVIEPSTMKAIILLTLILCVIRYQKRCAQAKC